MNQEQRDEILGITRCVRCGHRLEDGEIECPFCSLFPDKPHRGDLSKWVYLTACFLTSPLSLFFILKKDGLTILEKMLAFSGMFLWTGLYLLFF